MIAQYDLIAKTADYTIANANKAYLPQVSLTGIGAYIISGLPTMTLPGSAPPANDDLKFIGMGQVNQQLWDGGATSANKRMIAAGAAVDSTKLEVRFHQLRERVDQLFFGILLADAQLAQLDRFDSTLQRNLDKVSLLKENGTAYQSDVDEVHAELLKLHQRKIEFAYVRSGYVDMLSYLIGEPLDSTTVLQRPAVREDFASAPDQRPELGTFTAQRELATAQYQLGKTSLMPKVGLLGTGLLFAPALGFGTSEISSLALAGISLSWNTSGLYRQANDHKLHELHLARIANEESSFRFANGLDLRRDDQEVRKARAILAADEGIVALRTRIADAYQLKYDNGLCAMNDLIDALSEVDEARSDKALHEIQLLLAMQHYATDNGN